MSTKLLLFTREFPFSSGEPYLETEIQFYDKFDEVHLFALSVLKNNKIRNLNIPDNVTVHPIYFLPKMIYILGGFRVLFSKYFWKEVLLLKTSGKFNMENLYELTIFLSRSNIESNKIKKIIQKQTLIENDDKVILYSYRLDYSSFIASEIKIKAKKIYRLSRAHGIDLYEFRHKGNYIPLRKIILEKLNIISFISKQGKDYLNEVYPEFEDKFKVNYLGTKQLKKTTRINEDFIIVSCSNVISIKRVPLIFEALQKIDKKITWVHFGGGSDFNNLKNLSENARDGLNIILTGKISNEMIMEYYQNNYVDLFVNVSETEGLPVSIMEAFSVGIPVIATDVGGTSEIVCDQQNGYLLPKNINSDTLSESITAYINLIDLEKKVFRNNASKTWEKKFNAEKNYLDFVSNLLGEFK